MGKSDNASEFLDLYRRLEGCIRERYDVPEKHGPVAWLGRNPGRAFKSVAGALKYCAEVRNLLSHQESVDGDYAVEPSDSMLTLLRNTLAAVENPPKAIDHAVSMQNVFSATAEDCVRPVLREMAENATPTYLSWRMASFAVCSARTRCSPTYTVKGLFALTTRRHSLRLPSCSQWTLMPLNHLGSCHVR